MSPGVLILIARRMLAGARPRGGTGAVAGGRADTGAPATPTRRGRARLTGAVLGVALSLIPLVVVQQVAEGMIAGIVERFIETGTYHLQGLVLPGSEAEPLPREILDELELIDGVTHVREELQGFGLVYGADGEGGRVGVTLRAVETGWWEGDDAVRRLIDVTEGSFDLSESESIVLGVYAARRLAVDVGDEVSVLTARTIGGSTLPRVSRFRVAGIVTTGYRDLDRLWAFVPLERGRRVIPPESVRRVIGIKVADPFLLPNPLFGRGLRALDDRQARLRMEETRREVNLLLGGRAWVADWYEAEANRYSTFLTSRNLLALVMAMIVVVAAVNISSSLALLVVEHEEDFAIMRAIGARPQTLVAALLIAGLLVGVLGSALGGAAGLALAININAILVLIERVLGLLAGREVEIFDPEFYLEEIPVTLELAPFAGAVALAVAVSLLAAAVPAWRAAAVRPERILRRHG